MLFIYHVDILWKKNRSGKSAHMGILPIKLNGFVVIDVTHLKACKRTTVLSKSQPIYCTLYLVYSVDHLPKHFFCRCLYQYMQLALSEVWETQGQPISNPHCWKIKLMRGCCETAVLPKIPMDPHVKRPNYKAAINMQTFVQSLQRCWTLEVWWSECPHYKPFLARLIYLPCFI